MYGEGAWVHKTRYGVLTECALVCLLFTGGRLEALEPTQSIRQYTHTVWNRDSGQFQTSAFALAQTPDGSLWIGTDSGLVRFDGVRFRRWLPPSNQQLASEYVNVLAAARDGSLWIGTRDGLSHWKDATIQNYQTSRGSGGPGVTAIHIDVAGTIWAGTAGYSSGGLCRLENKRLHCYTAADGPPVGAVYSLFEDRNNTLWVGGVGLYQWKPAAPGTYVRNPGDVIGAIVEDREGELWVCGSGLKRLAAGRLVPYPILVEGKRLQPRALLADRDGGLWIGTLGQGLIRLYKGRIDHFTHRDGLSGDVVRCLLEDREGNVWAGTDGGLDQFRKVAVAMISKREGLSSSTVTSVFAAKNGGLWIGTVNGLNYIHGDKIGEYDKRNGLPSANILGLFEEQCGRLWVLTSAGLACSNAGRFRALSLAPTHRVSFAAATESRDHSVWFSDPEHGLIRVQDTRITEIVPWSQFRNRQAWALTADLYDGGLWLGFAQGGVAYYKSGQATSWYGIPGSSDGGAVLDLHQKGEGSLWIASRDGLSLLHNGQVTTLTLANGLPCDRVHAIVEDDDGALWLKTSCGLVRISGADLSAWSANPAAKVQARLYDSTEGMRGGTATGYFRRAAKSKDGRLWFAAYDGVAVVDPRRLPENRLPPGVRIEGIATGYKMYPSDSGLRLPPLTKELRIDYTAMSFVAPEKVHFRYRLDGFDNEWHEVGCRRQAVYKNLPPKQFRFQVIACNNDGIWNDTGATFDFSIDRALYQTTWFRLLCLLGVALLLWSLRRLRLRQMSMQLNLRFQGRLAERTRIAGEIHDSLLQHLCGFALQFDGLSKNPTVPALVRDRLRDIRQETEHCMQEAREFVWDLRAPAMEEKDLAKTLREAGEQIANAEPVQFHVTVRGNRYRAPTNVQQHLVRIVQEATRNAVRHSRAKEIQMIIDYLDAGLIRIQMRDDGCGFDMEKASRELGHWGLTIMRERAREIGAELRIDSAPGHGTEIDILAPIVCSSK